MKKVDWKIIDTEDNKVVVEFTSNEIVNKLSFEWNGNEEDLIERIDNAAMDFLDQIESRIIIDDNTKRKLVPLKGTKTIEDVIKRKNDKPILRNEFDTMEEI